MISKLLLVALTGFAFGSNDTTTASSSSSGNGTTATTAGSSSSSGNGTTATTSGSSSSSSATTASSSSSSSSSATTSSSSSSSSSNSATTSPASSSSSSGSETKNETKNETSTSDVAPQDVATSVSSKATLSDSVLADKDEQAMFANANTFVILDLMIGQVCKTSTAPVCNTAGKLKTCCVAADEPSLAATGLTAGMELASGDAGLLGMVKPTARRSLGAAPVRRLADVDVTYTGKGKASVKVTAAVAKTRSDMAVTQVTTGTNFATKVKSVASEIAAGTLTPKVTGLSGGTTITSMTQAGVSQAKMDAMKGKIQNATIAAPTATSTVTASGGSTSSAAGLVVSGFAVMGAALALF